MPTKQEVKFKRKTTSEINNLEVEDGALIYNVDNGKTYMDYGTRRIQTGGNADTIIAIGEEEPIDKDIKLWIDTENSETKASEVVDSLKGNQTNLAPSVNAVNGGLSSLITISEKGVILLRDFTSFNVSGSEERHYELTFKKTYINRPIVIPIFLTSTGRGYWGHIPIDVRSLSNVGCDLVARYNGYNNEATCGYIVISMDN